MQCIVVVIVVEVEELDEDVSNKVVMWKQYVNVFNV